jgi:hypothetical protein
MLWGEKIVGISKKITDEVVNIPEKRLKDLGKDKYVSSQASSGYLNKETRNN